MNTYICICILYENARGVPCRKLDFHLHSIYSYYCVRHRHHKMVMCERHSSNKYAYIRLLFTCVRCCLRIYTHAYLPKFKVTIHLKDKHTRCCWQTAVWRFDYINTVRKHRRRRHRSHTISKMKIGLLHTHTHTDTFGCCKVAKYVHLNIFILCFIRRDDDDGGVLMQIGA